MARVQCRRIRNIKISLFLYYVHTNATSVRGSCRLRWVADACTSSPCSFVEREKSVKLHNGEIVPEEDERRDVDDVTGRMPEMREELSGTGSEKPDNV